MRDTMCGFFQDGLKRGYFDNSTVYSGMTVTMHSVNPERFSIKVSDGQWYAADILKIEDVKEYNLDTLGFNVFRRYCTVLAEESGTGHQSYESLMRTCITGIKEENAVSKYACLFQREAHGEITAVCLTDGNVTQSTYQDESLWEVIRRLEAAEYQLEVHCEDGLVSL